MNKLKTSILAIFSIFAIGISPSYSKQPIEKKEFGQIFDKYKVTGSILIFDNNKSEYLGYDLDQCNIAHSPASTFKIPNTLIALETGVITTDSIFRWDGEKRYLKAWEADMDISTAYKVSNVPIYQAIARSIGLERMQNYIRLFNYGEMDINAENIDKFWLEDESKITQYQEIYFLKKLYDMNLPLKEESMQTMKKIMLWEDAPNYKLYAKTGWAVQGERDLGWFVGYIEANDNVYFFATTAVPTNETDMKQFGAIREKTTKEILSSLGIIR